MTRAIKKLKSTAKTIGGAAKWLWLLPPVRSVVLTNIARIGLGTTGVAIITAIFDAAAK